MAVAVEVAAVLLFPRLNHLVEREQPAKETTVVAAISEMVLCRLIRAAAVVAVVQVLSATRPAEQTQPPTVEAVEPDRPTQSLELQSPMAAAVAVVALVPEVRQRAVLAVVVEEQIRPTVLLP